PAPDRWCHRSEQPLFRRGHRESGAPEGRRSCQPSASPPTPVASGGLDPRPPEAGLSGSRGDPAQDDRRGGLAAPKPWVLNGGLKVSHPTLILGLPGEEVLAGYRRGGVGDGLHRDGEVVGIPPVAVVDGKDPIFRRCWA